ncbi:Retrovirus-related Pol polyprotein from transposon RE1 [Vitis vinifera]|uniref:Retrovirus-related Pol polyprotein from transposon RE1 n=1 Tax=Vitis vinifera TaxID=29760 RepID=A0A438CWW2_VITVI|nr:Retrovirus-related Pol polyprotein from transposon RE1 [Vitis vinifera]
MKGRLFRGKSLVGSSGRKKGAEAWLVELWDHSGDEGVWNPSFSRSFNDWEVEGVERLLLTIRGRRLNPLLEDRMLWKETKDGIFSVKSLYSLLASRRDVQFPYSNIWSICVPTKVSFFAWEAYWGKVLPSSVRDTLNGWSGFKLGKKRRKGESVSEARPTLTLDYLDVAVFKSTLFLISTPSPNIEGHLNSRGDTEIQTNRETLVYSRRPKSKSNETLTSEALKELEPVIVPTPQESGSNPNQCRAFTTNLNRIQIPKNIQESLEIPEWRDAVMEELRTLEKNGTWEVMTLPRGKKPMGSNLDWPLHQFDTKNAFVNGELEEEVFMTLPPGFCKEEEEIRVCKLKKSLYGHKESPRAWYNRFAKIMTREVERLKKVLATEFEVKDLGQMRYFLGMEVARSRKGISISQRKYVLDLLTKTGMLGCKPSDTPIKARKRTESDGKPVDRERYQRLVGRPIYLSHTRLDIAFAVSVVCQYMHSPKESHLEAVYKILRYSKGSPRRGLFFKKGDSKKVEIYTDADWAGSGKIRRSTIGYCTYVWGNLVTWRSKK